MSWKPGALCLLAFAAASAACSRSVGPPGADRGGVPVEVVTLAERPVEQTTEFLGTVRSRRSTTVQPQVEGFITRILVRSGDRVQPGTPLLEIDPSKQQASVANLESQRRSREAELRYARQEAARIEALFEAGASSRAELEQAQTALATAQAQLEAAEAQVREESVALAYHRVSAPTAGVVGDIPVRAGDSVTRSTLLTTIDQNAGMEVYISVPVQQAQHLRIGLPVHLVDDSGRLLVTAKLSFVAPSVDPQTQSVLTKAGIDASGGFRTDQFVRARVVWTETPALTVPLVAVNRINGQYFGFVVETDAEGKTAARQRQLELGAVVGNDYVVRSGLKAGDKLIVSGVQKIADGVPVTITAAAAPGGRGD